MSDDERVKLLAKENRRLAKKLERCQEELLVAEEVKDRYVAFSNKLLQEVNDGNAKLTAALEELKQTNISLNEMAITDSLTELYNRHYFNMVFDREVQRARRSDKLLAWGMVDVDCFKQYNDTYGHHSGDKVLSVIGSLMRDTLKRSSEFVFRLGGEEFGFLICDTSRGDGLHLAESLRHSIYSLEIEHKNNSAAPYVTVSMGLVMRQGTQLVEPDTLYRLADEALYGAKEKGRNLVVSG